MLSSKRKDIVWLRCMTAFALVLVTLMVTPAGGSVLLCICSDGDVSLEPHCEACGCCADEAGSASSHERPAAHDHATGPDGDECTAIPLLAASSEVPLVKAGTGLHDGLPIAAPAVVQAPDAARPPAGASPSACPSATAPPTRCHLRSVVLTI